LFESVIHAFRPISLKRSRSSRSRPRQVFPENHVQRPVQAVFDGPMGARGPALFRHITQTWRGTALISRETVVEPIASTTTGAGLTVLSFPKVDCREMH
jgi:hypothetical protein